MNKNFKFEEEKWFTNRTYNTNFKSIPEKSGVYLLVNTIISKTKYKYEILYVGSSKNLKKRYGHHNTLRVLNEIYGNVRFYFKETEDFINTERRLIKQIQARYNTQWR